MKARFVILLTVLIALGVVSSYGCNPSEKHFYTVLDKKDKNNKKGWLGVNLEDVTGRLAKRKDLDTRSGAYITSVVKNSPAADAGIKKGDVIVKYNGSNVDDSQDLTDMVRDTKPGTSVDIVVERDKEKKTLKAEIDNLSTSSSSSSWSYSFNDDDEDSYNYDFDYDDDMDMDFDIDVPDPPHVSVNPRIHVYSSSSSMHGIVVQNLSKQLAEYFEVPGKKGALVTEVKKNSDAEKAGLKAGDIITKIGSSTIWDDGDVRKEFQHADEGEELSVEIFRKGKSSNLKIKIEDNDDQSMYNVTPGNGHHFYFKNKADMTKLRESLREIKQTLHEQLKGSLGETKKELQRVKEELRKELHKM